MKDKIQIGLTELIPEDEPEECPGCVDGVCQCANEEEGFKQLEKREEDKD